MRVFLPKTAILAFLPLLCLSISVTAQENARKFEIRGVIEDKELTIIPGFQLRIKSGSDEIASPRTNINGEFQAQVPEGDFVITADALREDKFRVFIKLGEKDLNPNYLHLIVDSNEILCSGHRTLPTPRVINSATIAYPPAARAVRAGGDVTLEVMIAPNGSVISAKALTGHPLLKRVSELTLEKYAFETSSTDAEREALITFVFMPDEHEKPGLKRYSCPYRIVVFSQIEIINTTNYSR